MPVKYARIIHSYAAFSSARMLIGASSALYMLASGLGLYDIGLIKSGQMAVMLLLGFVVGTLSDCLNRKTIYLFSLLCAVFWLGAVLDN